MPLCLVFPAITNCIILKTTTAIDSSQKSPALRFFRFSVTTLVAEIFDILSKTQIFSQSFSQSSTKLANKLLEISVGVSNQLLKYFLFPLLWGSLEWLKIRLIRFLSKVIAKNTNGQILPDGPYMQYSLV